MRDFLPSGQALGRHRSQRGHCGAAGGAARPQVRRIAARRRGTGAASWGKWCLCEKNGVGNCPILGILDITL